MAGKPQASSAPSAPALPVRYRLVVFSRAVAGIGLGYVLAALASSLLALLLPVLGMHRADAVTLAGMLAFILYACTLVWTFACANAWRVWWVLGGGALGAALLLWLAQSGRAAA
ncbi:iron transporter [Allofranklinella schreckenbergeri]|uniref:Iron transporter n=1 Tax=Allofranklinella schreckenbergeri TaxID=1076744 RepID=A0A3M6QCY1_9BURK|nr:iron transporter [Allofranklinella schreckenbergeri]RMX00964.1 iron transporter [Allofranklinella schreckenbergeri]RRD44412.1 iron transporter [Comamonadaceae bacterium OH3737_COT-264]